MAKKQVIKLTEGDLHNIIKESVKQILKEGRKPNDAYFGGYFFEGIHYTRNGNPIYYSKHLPIEVMDMLGWRKSTKWGRCGYATNWLVCDALKKLGLPYGDDEEEYYNSLTEGKTVNNKPFFTRGGRNMMPGKSLSGSYLNGNDFLRQKGYKNFLDADAAVRRGELDKNTFDKWYDEHMKAVNKHNDRLEYNWGQGNDDDWNTLDS